MKIRTPLIGLLSALSLSLSAAAVAQEPVVLKFSHEAPETAIKGKTALVFAEKVKEFSKGTMRVDVFPGAQLIPTKDEVRSAIRGQVDIIAPQTSYYVPLDPSWDVFYQPLLFDSAKAGMDALQGDLGRELLGNLERIGLHGLGIWHDGPGYLFTTGEPATLPKDLEGKKIRLFPSAPLEEGVRLAGGIPVSMPGPDVYLSLQQGMIDGVITAVTYAAPSKWYEVLKGMTRMTMFIGGYGVTINKARWNKLSDEHKDVLKRAMAAAEEWNYERSAQNIADAEKTLGDNGVKLEDLSSEDLKKWREIVAPVYEKQPEEVRSLVKRVQG